MPPNDLQAPSVSSSNYVISTLAAPAPPPAEPEDSTRQ